jgi:CRISPR-associated endonuclease Cas1
MAATANVSQHPPFRKPARTKSELPAPEAANLRAPRSGVITLFGFGIRVQVDHGHLLCQDGIGPDGHNWRLPRVGHGLRRLVVIGADGGVSLAALRWLADQDAAFVVLERNGRVLLTTGPARSYDARLRRAQAMAFHSGAALQIARELISQKLGGQEQVVRDRLHDSAVAATISGLRTELASAKSIPTIRLIESEAAVAYWSTWRDLPITFPKNDLHRVPDRWRTFGSRVSPLSGSPRLAVNPINGILNYLYALLESEARLAAAALGLDPALGVLHSDTPSRDSLADDLIEAARAQVDALVLDFVTRAPLKREWFHEQRDGNCRLMASLAAQLSETTLMWRKAVAPHAESVARVLWSTVRKSVKPLATPLTEQRRRKAQGSRLKSPIVPTITRQNICQTCGATIDPRSTYCLTCFNAISRDNIVEVARVGRVTSQSPEAQVRRSQSQKRQAAARQKWVASDHPAWLTPEVYTHKIQPLLRNVTITAIASALGVSAPYAASIRAGKRHPHERHFETLAELVGASAGG